MAETLIFENWEARCSSLGHLMTNLEKITEKQLQEIKDLEYERDNGINKNGNKVKWQGTTKPETLADLIKKRDAPDELPPGAITHLEDVFRSVFWGRKRLLFNKYLDKGNICEQDSLSLKSKVDKTFYVKNSEHFSNGYIKGTPDEIKKLIDTKSSFDMDSFDKAVLTDLYKFQLKGYAWLLKKSKGTLSYCLVNNPIHQIIAAKKSLWYQLGMPEHSEQRWKDAVQQLERNMIFDIEAFKKEHPDYEFENEVLDFDVPAICRVKDFEVELFPEDIHNIVSRVLLARKWLINKELETLAKINKWQITQN